MIIIGHRGAMGLAPENTIESIQKALQSNVDAIECDARVTKDHVVILAHDRQVRCPDGSRLAIRERTLAELRQQLPQLTTLAEAITAVNRRAQLIIEVKAGEPITPIATVVSSYLDRGWQPQDLAFASFKFRQLRALQRTLPAVPRIVNEMWSGVRASIKARLLGSRQIALYWRWLWPGYIRAVHHSGHQLYTFTLNNPAKARRWQQVGLAGVVTDYPDRFQK